MSTSVNFNFGSDYDFYNRVESNNVGYSVFDLSYLKTTQLFDGYLIPVGLWETLPGDEFDLSLDFLVKTTPLLVPVMSSYKIFFNSYYLSNYDMWRDFKNFVTRGRSGTYEVVPPQIAGIYEILNPSGGTFDGCSVFCQNSLWSYLELPQLSFYTGSNLYTVPESDGSLDEFDLNTNAIGSVDSGNTFVSAFPFFMYQRIWRDYYTSPNLLQNDKNLFPDDDDDIQLKSGKCNSFNRNLYEEIEFKDSLFKLRSVDFRKDYFSGAMPWPQRGTPPSLSSSVSGTTSVELPALTVDSYPVPVGISEAAPSVHVFPTGTETSAPFDTISGSLNYFTNYEPDEETVGYDYVAAFKANFTSNVDADSIRINYELPLTTKFRGSTVPVSVPASVSLDGLSITMSDLRVLSALNLWQERNGRTDGDYNSMIRAHFGVDPRIGNHSPRYIGGYYQNILFSEVVQTSAPEQDSPLGSTAGRGQIASYGNIGRFRSPDFGWIMTVAYIVPDISYAQGIDRKFTRQTFADYYYPEFNALGPQGILNKELFANFDNSGDGSVASGDNNLFAWQNRYDELRLSRNVATGSIGSPWANDWNKYTNIRWFDSQPSFNSSFVNTAFQLNHDAFSTGTADFPFLLQVANRARVSRPLPYYAIPSSLGIK